jgi:hypothetical protein
MISSYLSPAAFSVEKNKKKKKKKMMMMMVQSFELAV